MLIALSMKSEQPFSFIRALDKLLSYKGIDERDLQFKRTLWFTTFGISCFVSAMFIPVLVFQVKTLLLFGILLLCIYIPSLILMFILPYKNKSIVHISQHLTILITFYCIVKLGGLHQSGGIILAGLSMVITSATMFNSNRWSVWYFSLYMVCTLIVAGIQMKYKISPEMPSHVNHIFSLINTLCLSAYTLVIVLVYIKQYTQIEKGKADHLRHLDDVKTKLYTNITHEFRTPLTVIEGMADQIESQPDKWLKRGLEKIRQNSRNLLHLVDQMLDLARLEAEALPMKMVHGDVIRYLKMLSESFDSLAESKGITLSFSSDIDSYCMDYDADKLGKILTNLLSNAIKYTASEGVVSVNVSMVDRSGTKLILEFTDTGIGIESEKLGKIFDRFYRVEKEDYERRGGSGLGLAITRELVQLLNGHIIVESKVNKGTSFIVELPVSHNALEEIATEEQVILETQFEIGSDPRPLIKHIDKEFHLPILLIVEDNQDVTEYLISILEETYHVEVAKNGNEGFERALSHVPDIILSDVMMPEMDGINMLGMLKKDIRTSHIPVILLTAKADIESKLLGLGTGAEGYLEKPFNKEELFIRLKMLVELRKKLRARYSTFIFTEPGKNISLQNEDNFMYKLHEIFRNHIGDEDFGSEQLCEVLAMSRAQLYRKFKALTNRSIIEYLQSYRLHIAHQMLINSNLNVTQVAFEVGFKNLSHFSHRFHEEHGIRPSDVKKHSTEILR